MTRHSVLEARNNLSRLIAQSQSGIEVVITNRGTPVAQLVPVGRVDIPLTGAALVEWIEADPLPPRLVRTPEELDAQIAEARAAWQ